MTESVRLGLLAAYRKLMQPLVRILIRHGISLGELTELLRNVFVEVATRDFTLPDRKVSQSRVAILTGMTRKEVARQEAILAAGASLNIMSTLNRVTRVLDGWHMDPEFTGPYGVPLELPFDAREGGGASFVALVRKHSGDMAPRAMLDELLRVGVVERTSAGAFKVLMRAYIPESFQAEALQRFGEVVRDFVNTYEFNMGKRAAPGRFERIVYANDGLRAELMPAFEALLKAKGMQLLIELDNWMSAQDSDSPIVNTRHRKRIRTGVGIYHFVSEEPASDLTDPTKALPPSEES
jgi:Family of unknown function (DUF6502)